jgi:Tol biopolymer transport system component
LKDRGTGGGEKDTVNGTTTNNGTTMKTLLTPGRLAALVLATAMLAGCAGKKQGTVVFHSNRDGNFDLYVMADDGGGQRRLTDSPTYEVSPVWSPDGSRIAYSSNEDGDWNVYTIRPDGTDKQRVTKGEGGGYAPSWSVDGKEIIFVSTAITPHGQVYGMPPEGGDLRDVTNDSAVKDFPMIAQGGKSLLVRVLDGSAVHLTLYDLATSSTTVLSRNDGRDSRADVSADGREALFVSSAQGNLDVYAVNLESREVRPVVQGDQLEMDACWADGGAAVIFSRAGSLIRKDLGTGVEKILSTQGDFAPDWTDVPHIR